MRILVCAVWALLATSCWEDDACVWFGVCNRPIGECQEFIGPDDSQVRQDLVTQCSSEGGEWLDGCSREHRVATCDLWRNPSMDGRCPGGTIHYYGSYTGDLIVAEDVCQSGGHTWTKL